MPPRSHQLEPETEEQAGPPPVHAGVDDDRFAANVREMRSRLGISQGELARRMSDLGWPWYQQTVRRTEEGGRKVAVGEAKALARIGGTTVDRLTLPSREASAASMLESGAGRAFGAHEQIAAWTNDLMAAQWHLAGTISEAERSEFAGTPLIARLLAEARNALALVPEDAVAAARRERAEGDEE
jgi:transcriptional regulator with XRE-family HTH domain